MASPRPTDQQTGDDEGEKGYNVRCGMMKALEACQLSGSSRWMPPSIIQRRSPFIPPRFSFTSPMNWE